MFGLLRGLVDLWTCGLVDLWTCGLVDLWTCGLVDLWTCGLVDLWTCGLVQRHYIPSRGFLRTTKGAKRPGRPRPSHYSPYPCRKIHISSADILVKQNFNPDAVSGISLLHRLRFFRFGLWMDLLIHSGVLRQGQRFWRHKPACEKARGGGIITVLNSLPTPFYDAKLERWSRVRCRCVFHPQSVAR